MKTKKDILIKYNKQWLTLDQYLKLPVVKPLLTKNEDYAVDGVSINCLEAEKFSSKLEKMRK